MNPGEDYEGVKLAGLKDRGEVETYIDNALEYGPYHTSLTKRGGFGGDPQKRTINLKFDSAKPLDEWLHTVGVVAPKSFISTRVKCQKVPASYLRPKSAISTDTLIPDYQGLVGRQYTTSKD